MFVSEYNSSLLSNSNSYINNITINNNYSNNINEDKDEEENNSEFPYVLIVIFLPILIFVFVAVMGICENIQNNYHNRRSNVDSSSRRSSDSSISIPEEITFFNINQIETIVLKTGDNQTNKECPICFDSLLEVKEIKKLNCDHLFCNECLDKFLNTNNSSKKCPLCRANINAISYIN